MSDEKITLEDIDLALGILDKRIEKIENNIDYARFDVQEQRIEKLEKFQELEVWSIRLKELELAIKNSPPNSHLKQEITELEKKEDRDYSNINELRRQIEVNDKEIAELRRKVEIQENYKKMFNDCIFEDGSTSQIRINKDQLNELKVIEQITLDTLEVISKDYKQIKEVLRELIEMIYNYQWIDNPETHDRFPLLLAKLEVGSASARESLDRQTEVILSENLRTCCECQKIFESIKLRKNHEHCIHGIGEFIKDEPKGTEKKEDVTPLMDEISKTFGGVSLEQASGGEKERIGENFVQNRKPNGESNSKPPEPKLYSDMTPEEKMLEVQKIPTEPKITIKILVKREDLERLLIGYEDYAHSEPIEEEEIEYYKRIKEAYGIE